jgi:hypothetical protein
MGSTMVADFLNLLRRTSRLAQTPHRLILHMKAHTIPEIVRIHWRRSSITPWQVRAEGYITLINTQTTSR